MRVLSAVLAISLAGCATEEEANTPPSFGIGLGTPDSPIPHEGSYALQTKINLTAQMPRIDVAVSPLRAFALDPAHTLIGKAREVSEPALAELEAALSATLRDRLEGWINAEILKGRVSSMTTQQYATSMADMVVTALSQVTVESSLAITPSSVTHTLTGLNLRPGGLDVVIPMGGLAADVLTQHPTAAVAVGGALTIGDEKFGIAFGDHVWQGINLAGTSLYGGDLATSLASGVSCAAIAQVVATKCVNTSCVGHAAQLQDVCEAGIATLAADVRDDVRGFKLDMLRFATGTAHLVDDNQNGEADRIVDGTWNAQVDAGGGPLAVTATFLAAH